MRAPDQQVTRPRSVNPGYYWPVTYARSVIMGTRPAQVPELIPVADAGIAELFPDGGAGRMEASGVLTVDDGFLVVFDDSRNVGVIGSDLSQPTGNRVITPAGSPVPRPWEG